MEGGDRDGESTIAGSTERMPARGGEEPLVESEEVLGRRQRGVVIATRHGEIDRADFRFVWVGRC